MPTRRRFLEASGAALASSLAWSSGCSQDNTQPSHDLLVYGATPAGIAAAVAAADDGCTVLLVEPTPRIGGMITCGLSHTDFRTFEGLNGVFNDFRNRIIDHYTREYGADSEQVRDTFRGTQGEPKINLQIFQQMIAERPSIQVVTRHRLTRAEGNDGDPMRSIHHLDFDTPGGATSGSAAVFLDGTYEGDLLAAAGVEYRVGREGRDEYNESLAPPEPDNQLQGYNFRLIATRDPNNRIAPEKPSGYNREDYGDVLPLFADGTMEKVFGYPRKCVYKAQIPRLPNGKYDINDVSRSPVRMSLPGDNLAWPEGDTATRQRIFDEHMRWNVGMLWFLQNDNAVPARVRDEAREWGWCADELTETNHLPPQLYVREARRMVGLHVYTEQDTRDTEGDARAVLHSNSIAMGEYSHNCHGTAHEGPRIGGRHTGEFYKEIAPYQVPYGTLVPRDVSNLLVPVAASSSHVGFCALRLEPIWMALGQAAGHAAALSVDAPVQKAPVTRIQERLWSEGAATIYVSDVDPDHADFAAVQWWGSIGGLHGLEPAQPKRRGANILGQYHEAYPGHAVQLDRELDAELHTHWTAVAAKAGLTADVLPAHQPGLTRGDWIREVRNAQLARG